jgi:hypothetical protein
LFRLSNIGRELFRLSNIGRELFRLSNIGRELLRLSNIGRELLRLSNIGRELLVKFVFETGAQLKFEANLKKQFDRVSIPLFTCCYCE